MKCAAEVAPKIGFLIYDEVHRFPAPTFLETVRHFDCSYMLGLSATHRRRDGLEPLIYWHVGPLVYEMSQGLLVRGGDLIPVEPIIRKTTFVPSPGIDPTWQRTLLIDELCSDEKRNSLIVGDIIKESGNGPCIVLTDRKAHADRLTKMLVRLGVDAEVCHGDVPRREQARIIRDLDEGRLRILVATGQLLGEGFDCQGLTTLFLTTPIKFSGRLIQYLGRVARTASGKTSARVYDYHDINVPILMKAAKERLRTYNKLAKQTQGPTPVKGK